MTDTSPSLPIELTERWGVISGELIADTRTSLVHRVLRQDGSYAITKQLKPDGMHEMSGVDFLAWRQGQGAVRVLDRLNTASLLEDAGTLTLKDFRLQHGEEASNEVILDVIGKMHGLSANPAPQTLVPLRLHFQSLFYRASGQDKADLADALTYSAAIADELVLSQENIRPLHGDLHHENIVSGSGREWLAIDPQGLLGDPAYEVANVFGNPDGAFADIINPQRILRLIGLFASAIGCEPEKILRYAIAHAGLSICWSLASGDRISEGGNAMERLAFLKVARDLFEDRRFIS